MSFSESSKASWLCNEVAGDLADSSGNGHTAVKSGTITYDASGKFGRCIVGNGSTGFFTVGAHADFRPGTGDFCVNFWIYAPLSAPGLTCVIDYGYATATGFMVYYYPDAYMYIQDSNITSFDISTSPDIVVGWNHFMIMRISGVMKMYANKVSQTLIDDSFGSQDITYAGDLIIGKYATYYFNRKYDEIAFFNKGFIQSEVNEMYAIGLASDPIRFFTGVS
jgi:hypothetical protein